MSMPAHKSAPAKKPLNPPPRHEHTEWHAPREGMDKGQQQGATAPKPRAKPKYKKR